ncbi:MAG: exodeoxyribonuclease VII large subunit [Acidimicrobiia bacterium]|nr:exodeoxyribonuclease VII large subunit [Acidimicrobiia bacterium]MDH5238019.1 exodeoxyribonuclease VII large subunit [Acidimicrobiia bacterium]
MDDTTYTVAELAGVIANQLAGVFPDDVWVTGQISGLNRSGRGHVYFDLIEPPPEPGQPAPAQLAVVLWNSNREIINRQLSRAGVGRMVDGMQVRVRAVVDFYEVQGRLQLRMTGVDPTHTLGQLALQREQLRKKLVAEGLFDRNRHHRLPLVPYRVGLITSVDSAAHADFMSELEGSGLSWHVVQVDARVQGDDAEPTIVAALRVMVGQSVDLVCLVRGGGSRGDLSVFDREPVVRAIAELPVPVLTGIGHEIDSSLADEAAHTAYKTPTACAQAVVSMARLPHQNGLAAWHAIARATERALHQAGTDLRARAQRGGRATEATLALQSQRLVMARAQIRREIHRSARSTELGVHDRASRVADHARRQLGRSADRLAEHGRRLTREGPRALDQAAKALQGHEQHVQLLDPVRTMARGWSITRTADGRTVRTITDITDGDELLTQVADGRISSFVQRMPTSEPPGDDQ